MNRTHGHDGCFSQNLLTRMEIWRQIKSGWKDFEPGWLFLSYLFDSDGNMGQIKPVGKALK